MAKYVKSVMAEGQIRKGFYKTLFSTEKLSTNPFLTNGLVSYCMESSTFSFMVSGYHVYFKIVFHKIF